MLCTPEFVLCTAEAALGLLDKALEEAPELIDLHSARARCLKHAGDLRGAAAAAVQAQDLEKSDR